MEDKKEISDMSQAEFLSQPVEVLFNYTLPHLEYADLLRFRRACRQMKTYSDDFIRNSFKSQVREVNEANYPFRHYLETNLPTTSIFLNNSSPAFFGNPDIPEFLRLYGAKITHVRIHHFDTFIFPLELHFFSNLPNLVYLDIDFIDSSKRNPLPKPSTSENAKARKICREIPFPQNFKNLKTLKLNKIQGSLGKSIVQAWDFVEFCENLEFLTHPLYEDRHPSFPVAHCELHPFNKVTGYINRRHQNNPEKPNLQFYDLQHENSGYGGFGNGFGNLRKLCSERNVKLLNVYAASFSKMNMGWTSGEPLSVPEVVSMRNVHGYNFLAELPNLEKLVIESTRNSSYTDSWPKEDYYDEDEPVNVPTWPSLKILYLTIDSRTMDGDDSLGHYDYELTTKDFLEFLFDSGKKREKVTELAIRYFVDEEDEFMEMERLYPRVMLPMVKVKDVTETCPFVTKLTLGNWMGRSEQVALFWEGLPLLEEVELEKCTELDDGAFVGKRWWDPIFLKLKHLKKVTLKELDVMPKITDLVFKRVFRHLKIKQFCLTGEKPLKSVTAAGIESLINGEFNKSVEKFPFDGWSLDGVSEEGFLELKLKFRASQMI